MSRGMGEAEFDLWMKEWADTVTRFAFHHIRHEMTAQDISQETFLRAFQHFQTQRRPPSAGWLFKVASRLVIDEARRKRREVVGETDVIDQASPFTSIPADEVVSVLEALPDRDRECLVLFYFRDWSVGMVAQHLGIPPTTVRTRLFRARERFRRLWEVQE